MRQELFFQEQPDPLHGVEFGRAGRQGFESHAWRDAQRSCLVPPRLIENQEDMLVGVNRFSKLVEIDLHGIGRNLGQDEREGVIRARLNGAVDIGKGVALIASPRGPLAPCEPLVTDASFWPMRASSWKKRRIFLPWRASPTAFRRWESPL